MSLGFLVPAFLAGLAAIGVPIWLHLRHSEKNKPLRFPSLMFLERLPIRVASRRRLFDVPLLLLRVLALALIALAFARPFLAHNLAATLAKRPRAVVVLLDRSASMGHPDVWPAALDSARAAIAGIGPEDRIALVGFDEEAEIDQSFTADQNAARAALSTIKPSSRGTRFAVALRAARQLLTALPEATHEVVIVTDLQRNGVAGLAGVDLPTDLTIHTAPVAPKSRANTSIASVDVRRIASPDRTNIVAQARVVAHELPAPRTVRATLALNGRPSGTKTVNLPASGDVTVAFDAVPLPSGRVTGTVSLEPDALPFDDTFHFTLPDEDALRVVLVVPDDAVGTETLYFERALAIGRSPTVRVERRAPGPLDAKSLQNTALVVLWDTPPIGNYIADWVHAGGGLAVVAGRRLATRSGGSPLVPGTIGALADRMADRGGTFGDVSFDHPLFKPFRDARAALSFARFWSYPRVQAAPGADVIARFDDGLPAIIERRDGAGRVVLLAVPLDNDRGDLPLQPAYLPLLLRLVSHASGHESAPLWRLTGDNWNPQISARVPVVSSPSGKILRPAADSAGAAVPLTEAGVYSLYDDRVTGEPVAVVAVNPPPGESDLTAVDARELLLGVRTSNDAADKAHVTAAPKEVEGRQGLWRFALAAVALLLLMETVLATRGWRGLAGRVTVAPTVGSTERSAQ